MMELADTDTPSASTAQPGTSAAPSHSDEHLADRCMYLKEYDLFDIDRGHFWHKLSWNGIHVEFPHRLYHYDPDPSESLIRDYFVALPVGVLEDAFTRVQNAPRYTLCHGDHCFVLEWDDEIQRHLHCYYERSEQGRERDRQARELHMRRHTEQYETNRQFPSKRLNAELEHLRAQQARAQQAVDAWDVMIAQCEERIARDQLLHLGRVPDSTAGTLMQHHGA